jgi:TRAP-type C4-dicarboxylate transport system permease small subunit
MQGFLGIVEKIIKFMDVIAGVALTSIILLTTADVLLRAFGHPILGTYEIVAILGGIVIGFATPITSWKRGHVFVDFLTVKLGHRGKNTIDIITRVVAIALFLLVASSIMKIAGNLREAQEVSATIQLPLYPIAYGIGAALYVLSLVLFCDILKIKGGSYE